MKYILILLVILSSCVSTKQFDTRSFKVTAVAANSFTAVSGQLVANFTRVPGDSIWIGKVIEVSRAKRIR